MSAVPAATFTTQNLVELAFVAAQTGVNAYMQSQAGTPNLTDLSIQVSTYGNAMTRAWGPENRMAGNVIWSSGLKKKKHGTGLKAEILGGAEVVAGAFTGDPMLILSGVSTAASGFLSPAHYSYSTDIAIALVDCQKRGPISDVHQVWANGKLIYTATDHASGGFLQNIDEFLAKNTSTAWSSFKIYKGGFTQRPDPTIEAAVGVGKTPAYRGTAYIVFSDFQLADYGNRIPNFEFLVEADAQVDVSEVLSAIVDESGIDPNTVSTTSVSGAVRGFTVSSSGPATTALQSLATIFNFDIAENSGALRFYPRDLPPVGIIDPDDMGAYQAGDTPPELISYTRVPESTLPQQAAVSYIDPTMNWLTSSQASHRNAGNSQSNISVSVPITLDADTAKQVADRLLWEGWAGRFGATVTLSDRWINIEPGRSYLFETAAGYESFRVTTKTRGANGVLEIGIIGTRPETYHSAQTGARGNAPAQVVLDIPETFLMVLDIPILRDIDDDTGFYAAVGAESLGWRGADVIRSIDAGATYSEVTPVGVSTIMGQVDFVDDGTTSVIDHVTTIRVTLIDEEQGLESITEEQLLAGGNSCWIGNAAGENGEILQFMTATLVSGPVWEISNLLRGRLGTEYATGRHEPNENFVLLQGAYLIRPDFTVADWGRNVLYKAVSVLSEPDQWPVVSFVNTGEGKRPLSPVHISARTDSISGDMSITWTRRSRFRQPGLGRGPVPLGESVEAYETDLIVASETFRTLTSSTPSVVYTAAMQAADGVSPGDTIRAAVYQMSDIRGRGRPGYAELTI